MRNRLKSIWSAPETVFALVCLALGVLGYAFLGSLVAEPKVLFGRSLTAIAPSLFPSIVLAILAVLCGFFILRQLQIAASERGQGITGWKRGVVFFAVMTAYALLMEPIGFILSSAIAVGFLSWFIGNRSIPQIVILAAGGPLLLYLAATRLLAVSLPELNVIELAIARMLGG